MDERQVVELKKSSKSAAEWDANLDKVKAAYRGGFPPFWYTAIMSSGVAIETAKSYGSSTNMDVTAFRDRSIDISGRPSVMPYLKDGEQIIGLYDLGLRKERKVCQTLAEMQELYDFYYQGNALSLRWFIRTTRNESIPTS
jgi:hypothetical protein